MIPGKKFKLMPFRHKKRDYKVTETYMALFVEDVTFFRMSLTGNAIIIDANGLARYCNPKDLYTPIE